MKKTFRLIAALLALCVLSATVPPVGLAADSGYFDLRAAVDAAAPKATITLPRDAEVGAGYLDTPWIISKEITIDGQGHSIFLRPAGIVLGADVTFKNLDLRHVHSSVRNAIIANGHTLTLENVTAGAHSINLFCGTLIPANYEKDNFTVPTPGQTGTIIINGNTSLQGSDSSLGPANIFAGSLCFGGMDQANNGPNDNGPANESSINAVINISDSKSSTSLGTIYACGAQQRIPVGASSGKETTPNAEAYTVSGTVTATGTNFLPNVEGAGASVVNVVYKGNGNSAEKTFRDISSLSVESGNLILQSGCSFQGEPSLSVLQGALLTIKDIGNPTFSAFNGGGSLILGQSQSVEITGAVSGKTTIGIGGIFSNASQTTPQENHSYIKAPNSQNNSFVLLPPTGSEMKLERDPDTGEWKVPEKVEEEKVSKVESIAPRGEVKTNSGDEDALIPLNPVYSGEVIGLETLNLTIRVNGEKATFVTDEDDGDYYRTADLQIYVGDLNNGQGELLMIYSSAPLFGPPPDGVYRIEIVVPGESTLSGEDISGFCTLIVGEASSVPTFIDVPKANTGLQWTGEEQIGVSEGTGYTLTSHKGTGVGSYTATATLVSGYQWTDGSTGSKTISWSIDKADGPSAPSGLAGGAPTAVGRSDGKITGTTGEMEYAGSASFSGAQSCGAGETTGLAAGTYYVRYQETATHKAGASVTVAVPAPSGGGSTGGGSTGGGSTGGGSTGGGSSSGGSSGSSSGGSSSTVKNPDGSTTVTSVNKTTGTVTETTKRPDGSKTVVESKEDGTVTILDTLKDGSTIKTVDHPSGTVEIAIKQTNGLTASVTTTLSSAQAEVRLPSKVIQGADGDAIPLPIPALPVSSLSDAVADITIHTGTSRPVPVEIPAEGSVTTVAYLVGKDGAETMLKTAVLDDGQITINVPDGATVRLRDNVRSFDDTNGHWAEESIAFVTARELFVGETAATFGPETPLTRAMLTTVLARLDGADTSGDAYGKGMAWAAAHGISDGQNPGGHATREQFVTMLYRYAGSPALAGREFWFYDAGEISPYARDAVQWAVENGILSGYGDGSIAPSASTTRAQSASILARYVKYLNRK